MGSQRVSLSTNTRKNHNTMEVPYASTALAEVVVGE